MSAVTIQTFVAAPIERVWDCWNLPEHIVNWAFASDEWEVLNPRNDLRVGGTIVITMAAKDKSASFDFMGTYTAVKLYELIEYDLSDGRHVQIQFKNEPGGVAVTEIFDAEQENSLEMQRQGWQAILGNFKRYAESRQD